MYSRTFVFHFSFRSKMFASCLPLVLMFLPQPLPLLFGVLLMIRVDFRRFSISLSFRQWDVYYFFFFSWRGQREKVWMLFIYSPIFSLLVQHLCICLCFRNHRIADFFVVVVGRGANLLIFFQQNQIISHNITHMQVDNPIH